MKGIAWVLLLACLLSLPACENPNKKKPTNKPAAKKKLPLEESSDVDFQAFLGRLRAAIEAHDVNTLASMMTTDFAYVLGSNPAEDKKGEGVFKYWEDAGLWPELEGIFTEKFVKKDDYMVAPPQFADPTVDYTGYRAGIKRINGAWKFVYFVNG